MSDEPIIVGFLCNWCAYRAADAAGMARLRYAPNLRVIRVMCSGRVEPQFVLKAFREGADGVLIGGCRPGGCHYVDGNLKMLRRFHLLKKTIVQFGIEPDRLQRVWASAGEGRVLAEAVNGMAQRLRQMGGLSWPEMIIPTAPDAGETGA